MLKIFLLGEIVTRLDDIPITRFRSQKELALLAYLAHTGQVHNRETVADLLWDASSTKQLLSNLRTALAGLRKQVGENLIVSRKTVAVTAVSHQQTDTVRFQAMMAGVGAEGGKTAVFQLKQALNLYNGEFMAGFSISQAPRFNDWLIIEQERLRQIAMRGYRQLASWQEAEGAFTAGVITAQRWVSWDPLDETAQQQLMRLLVFDGRIAEALAVYEKCRHLLQTELDLPPAPATTALYRAIKNGSLPIPNISHAPLHNIPRALTPLIGREKEIAKLSGYLLNPDYPYHQEALALFRQLNVIGSEQWLLGELGYTATLLGDYANAQQNLAAALTIAQRIQDPFWEAWVKARMGTLLNEQGKPEEAQPCITAAFAAAEQLKNPRLQGMVLLDWGYVLLNQTDWAGAEQKFEQSYALWTELAQFKQAMPALIGLAFAAYQQGNVETAITLAEKLWQAWQESPALAQGANLKLYWLLGMVWNGVGDSRADQLWKDASALLQTRSEKVADTRVRAMFLADVPAHRAILENQKVSHSE